MSDCRLDVKFDRDELLANRKWHSEVAEDLHWMPAQFDAMPLAERFKACVDDYFACSSTWTSQRSWQQKCSVH